MLQLNHIHKYFGNTQVLNDVSIDAKEGEIIALLGPSGAGKSTLLQCANLLLIPEHGDISFNNEIIEFTTKSKQRQVKSKTQLLKLRQQISMVFQQFHLWQHKTVLENIIEAPIHVLKKNKKQTIAQAEELLEKIGLSDKRNTYPKYLSGGQQQRIAIARALAMNSSILLLDEPTASLDPEKSQEVLHLIKTVAQDHKKTLLLATHEISFAREIADRILFMEQGKIVAEGNVQEMFFKNLSPRFNQFINGDSK